MYRLTVNGKRVRLDVPGDMPLLWVLRDSLGLVGTKYGCGIGVCGCCTVHIDGEAVRSCTVPISSVEGSAITTIEGLVSQGHPLLEAWLEENVPQCGYCQPGQIMTAAALLSRNPSPNERDINDAMSSNLCRCGTYLRIRKAIINASRRLSQK